MFLDYNNIDRFAIPICKLYIRTAYSEIFMVAATMEWPQALFEIFEVYREHQ